MMQENTERKGDNPPRMADRARVAASTRIDVGRLTKRTLLALVLPCTGAIAVDLAVGTWPLITLVTAALAFPLAGFLVMRAALQELQRVIQELAPEELAEGDEPLAGEAVAEDAERADGQDDTVTNGV